MASNYPRCPQTGLGVTPTSDVAYIGPTFAQVQVGPKRRAFLVRKDDKERLRDALLAASTIWGGRRCPILPVEEDGAVGEFWLQIARLLQVCEFVDFTRSPGGESGWSEASTGRWPITMARPLEDGRFWTAHPLLTFQPNEEMTFFLPAERSLRALASVGDVALEDEREMWMREGMTLLEGADEARLVRAQLRRTTVLDATVRYDYEAAIANPWMTSLGLIWIADDPEDFDEIVAFWNYRALRPHGYRTGLSILASRQALSEPELTAEILQQVRDTSYATPDVTVASVSMAEPEVAAFAESMGLSKVAGDMSEKIFAASPDSARTLTYKALFNPAHLWIGERSIGPQREVSMALQRPISQLRAKSPLDWNPKFIGRGHIALRFSTPELVAPPRPKVAQLFHRDATFQSGLLQLITSPNAEFNLAINVPDEHEILVAACADKSASFTLNDKGQQVRGVANVGIDLNVFRDADSIAVILALTPEADRDLKRKLEKLTEEGTVTAEQFDEFVRLSAASRFEARTLLDIHSDRRCRERDMVATRVAQVLDGLVANRLALRGWRVDCDICSLQVFQEVHQVTPRASCPGCNSNASYAVGGHGEPAMFYRLNTLLQRVSLNGGLAVLAATALLVGEGSYVVPGANVNIAGTPAGDLDILGWRQRLLFAGEAKMTAAGFVNQDVKRDVAKSVAVGADVHIAACLEEIPTDIQKLMSAACEDEEIEFRCLDAPALLS